MCNIQVLLYFLLAFAVILGQKPRIFGGAPSKEGQYPFYVSVRVFNAHFCGGSIIDQQWVLTAGHCCVKFTNYRSLLNVVAGIHHVDKRGYHYKVSNIIIHPGFFANESRIVNDICLIKLRRPIDRFTETIRTIRLEREFNDTERDVQIMGFGEIYQNSQPSPTLDWIKMKIVPYDRCLKIWMKNHNHTVERSDICAFAAKNKGTCHGDSGGGLIEREPEKLPKLIGIVSWGKPCAKGLPDVFTRISSFVNWIDSYTKEL